MSELDVIQDFYEKDRKEKINKYSSIFQNKAL